MQEEKKQVKSGLSVKDIDNQIRHAYCEYDSSMILVKEYTTTCEERKRRLLQTMDGVIKLYKEKCRALENELEQARTALKGRK